MGWIAVGLEQDVPPGVVIPSAIDGTDLAIWCSPSGQYHAWSDRCPHRGMRLSHGFVRGESLACIYHGWQYNDDGACSYIPAHPNLTPPATICVPTFPCKELHGVIWAALDLPEDAPPSLDNTTPVRSIGVTCSASQVREHVGANDAGIATFDKDVAVTLAIQPTSASHTMIHALAAPGQDRKAVSDWLEDARVTLEGAAS